MYGILVGSDFIPVEEFIPCPHVGKCQNYVEGVKHLCERNEAHTKAKKLGMLVDDVCYVPKGE